MSGMKISTIAKVLAAKVNKWINSIDDAELRKRLRSDTIVSGGAIASMMLGEPVNDYDIYFRTRETALQVAIYYAALFNELNSKATDSAIAKKARPQVIEQLRKNAKGVEENRIVIYMKSAGVAGEDQADYQYFESASDRENDEFFSSIEGPLDEGLTEAELVEDTMTVIKESKGKYRPVFLSENAVSLSDKVQLVIRFFGEPSEIHENYDFDHAKCYYDFAKHKVVVSPESMQAMLSKSLVYSGSLYPVASLFRIRKFIKRGWRITAGQMLKIIFQINNLDLNDRQVLREQLIGVDQAYMHQLLTELNKVNGRLDATYIANLIDTIFE